MEFLAVFVIFLGAVVGIRGNTWDNTKEGIKAITVTGWITLCLSSLGAIVAILITINANNAAKLATKREYEAAEREKQSRELLLAINEKAQETIERTERQQQTVMTQYLKLNPEEIWEAPNEVYGGTDIEVFFFEGRSLVVQAGYRDFRLTKDPLGGWSKGVISGDSGEPFKWRIINSSNRRFEGKVKLISTPRIRSNEWSWVEEATRIDE